MDKRDAVVVFKDRLREVIARSGLSRAKFAAACHIERSTLTQLLAEKTVRLPRSETLIAISASQQVSLDWLLGLSQQDTVATGILPGLEIAEGASSPADERLRAWHRQAEGYKIRYVPASLPDLLKTEDVIRYEHGASGVREPSAYMAEAADRLAYSRKPDTDIEVCSSVQSVEALADGAGIWKRLDIARRREQIERMAQLIDELYPTVRWFLFDGLDAYSAPYTVFGPQRAVTYVGGMYFVFNATEHIRVLSRHFDGLIRMAIVQPPDCARFLDGLLERSR
jgi:transcriptional regulator with XRE-family HTH domain